MKISSVIRVELTQDEVLEAITTYLQENANVAEGADVTFVSNDGETWLIDVKSTVDAAQPADKPKRTRRTKAEIEAAKAVENQTPAEQPAEEQSVEANAAGQLPADENEVPWTEEPKVEPGVEVPNNPLTALLQNPPAEVAEEAPKPVGNVSSIFTSTTHSAPVTQAAPPPPSGGAKSLFANLTKPAA
ncbi:hypothetical protein [Mesorhizobium sp. CN2-181]|uniref:hypothetical protein n=1 Tax=Mesorhizobium yinganensis TaxID=3157707 RepID=UPI0032B7CD19